MSPGPEWTDHGQVFPTGIVEDFAVIPNPLAGAEVDIAYHREGPYLKIDEVKVRHDFAAYYVSGPSFQDLRFHATSGPTPLGPFAPGQLALDHGQHTRLYRGLVDEHTRLVTAAWPDVGSVGIWLFRDNPIGMGDYGLQLKELLIPPKPGTGYSVHAGNPCVWQRWVDPDRYDIFFEGRGPGRPARWSLFHALWDGAGEVGVRDEPFLEGAANPSLLAHDGRLYLYYSKHAAGGFATCALSRAL